MGILADLACQKYMRTNIDKIGAGDYYSTEYQLFRKLPGLLALLRSRNFEREFTTDSNGLLQFRAREFFVDQESSFYMREDNSRYRSSRTERLLPVRRDLIPISETWQLELFDESN
jgi:hypothetical protein